MAGPLRRGTRAPMAAVEEYAPRGLGQVVGQQLLALNVPGENKADKMRNVGLLLCAKSYLTMSGWDADWKEFRAVCIDQNCWDRANSNTHMSKSGFFKTVSAADGMVLNSSGVEAAETLLSQLILGEHAAVK